MPSNVVWFERLFFLNIAVVIFGIVFWSVTESDDFGDPVNTVILAIVVALFFAGLIFLTYLAARRRKNWARWLLVAYVLLAIGVLGFEILSGLYEGTGVLTTVDIISVLLEITALYLIFTGNARDWFKKPIAAA